MPPCSPVNNGPRLLLCSRTLFQGPDLTVPQAIRGLRSPSAARSTATANRGGRHSRPYNTCGDVLPYTASFSTKPASLSTTLRPSDIDGQSLVPRHPRDKQPLARLPTHILYEHVRARGAEGRFDQVMDICRILVKDRGESLNKDMYTAVLHSFVSSSNGTAGKVRKVLEEMGFWNDANATAATQPKIELDARGCECVLEVLAVHPDYLLRAEILEYMRSRWFPLSDRGLNFVVAGLLRERHFEQALELLEDMASKNKQVQGWLVDKAMWMLLEFGEVEEAFHVLSLKQLSERVRCSGTATTKLSDALWAALLDAAAHKQLHGSANMVWMSQVQPGYLKPASGTCLSVLALAAQHGDIPLATDVFRVLTERETVLTTLHYELLVAAYLRSSDLQAALSVVLIMVDAKLKVDAGTCSPLYDYLSQKDDDQSSRPLIAFRMLQDFEAAGRKVPTAAVNACIQASITIGRFDEAIEIYKALHTVSQAGPDTQTFNILLRGCHQGARKDLAMFLANEMIELGLKPDRLTYDRLILVCLQADDLQDALLYYEEMQAVGASHEKTSSMKPRRTTWELLIHKCVVHGDTKAVALLKAYKQGVAEPRKRVEKAVVDRFQHGIVPDALEGVRRRKVGEMTIEEVESSSQLKSPVEMVAGVNFEHRNANIDLSDDLEHQIRASGSRKTY
ncbi:hypothetical protein ACN47E_009735 [Coniothyrium glycines]